MCSTLTSSVTSRIDEMPTQRPRGHIISTGQFCSEPIEKHFSCCFEFRRTSLWRQTALPPLRPLKWHFNHITDVNSFFLMIKFKQWFGLLFTRGPNTEPLILSGSLSTVVLDTVLESTSLFVVSHWCHYKLTVMTTENTFFMSSFFCDCVETGSFYLPDEWSRFYVFDLRQTQDSIYCRIRFYSKLSFSVCGGYKPNIRPKSKWLMETAATFTELFLYVELQFSHLVSSLLLFPTSLPQFLHFGSSLMQEIHLKRYRTHPPPVTSHSVMKHQSRCPVAVSATCSFRISRLSIKLLKHHMWV